MSVVNRSKRKNAGKRMAILGAKMAEEDEAFWNHETWADDDDSGNESFHESDEDSALQKDVFDSDFNDSESDNEDEEVAAGEAEEREIRKSERASKSMAYKQPGSKFGGHKRGRRGFPGGVKRVLGEGSNAGIVLNLPPESHDSLAYVESIAASRNASQQLTLIQTQQSTVIQSNISAVEAATIDTKAAPTDTTLPHPPIIAPIPSVPTTQATIPPVATIKAKAKTKPAVIRKQTRSMKVSMRERRSTHGARKLRGRGDALTTTQASTTSSRGSKAASGNTSDGVSRAAKRKKYAQEELLLEAVHETEPENQRWLHGRKRVQDQHNQNKDSSVLRDRHRGRKVIQKFHSRRGCLITLTFPEMDAVPEILTRRHESTKPTQQNSPSMPNGEKQETVHGPPFTAAMTQKHPQSSRCVITGKIGKYKDPLTKLPYHDLAAFKELRRRHEEGIPIVTKAAVTNTGSKEGSEPKVAPENAPRNNLTTSRKKTVKGGRSNKRATSAVASGNSIKKTTIVKREEENTLSSPTINAQQKLPFQSPKPPPNPSINGKGYPKNGKTTVPEKLALSLGSKSVGAATATLSSAKDTNSPNSPRRLSPRKWKPSEKILETISMLPEKSDGSVPRGLGIQPVLSVTPSLINMSNTTIANSSVATAPSSSAALAPTKLPPENCLSTDTKDNILPPQLKEPPSNGGPHGPANTVNTPIKTGSVAPVTSVETKQKAATQSIRANIIIPTKAEQSAPNGNSKPETSGEKPMKKNLTGLAGVTQDEANESQ